jgi:4-alpha-glucanotransferase
LNTPSREKWQRIGTAKRSGVLVPLFSVYSRNSLGVGDFEDLKLLIDWAAKTGNSIIQLLPMNEVGGLFCPYESLSSFALEPMYICLRMLRGSRHKSPAQEIEAARKMFAPGKVSLDYAIKKEKLRLLWEIFLEESTKENPEFAAFRKQNAYWLFDFALFKVLRDQHQGLPWYEWEDKYKERNPQELENFLKKYEKEFKFHIWVQWQLYRQFKEVKAYAAARKVLLKGDLPILVSRDSADVWSHREFFKLEFAAGAPPDVYCAKGQRWGMPTYHWEKIASDGYKYLREKLRFAQNFYDILRIDHVVGLFRIWSIPYQEPLENQGLNGSFDPRDESQWEAHGKKILSAILDNTDMLLCAEDLGVIPKACTKALEEFGIPGNDVQRWVKDWKARHDFLSPQEYRYLGVSMLSTHDTTNWLAWWEYEAGTADEGLFKRKCVQHAINFDAVKDKLFNPLFSRVGRLRWLNSIATSDDLAHLLGKKKEEITDIIDIYENTYQEKEKLWRHLGILGPMRERCDAQMVKAALGITLGSRSIFNIETILDWLFLTDILKNDPYEYRFNTPGTISNKNWSLVLPVSLEELLKHRVVKEIRQMIAASDRV